MFSIDDLDLQLDENFEVENDVSVNKVKETISEDPVSTAKKDVFRSRSSYVPSAESTPKSSPHSIDKVNLNNSKGTAQKNTPRQCVQRKFPGPAGLLPDMPPRSFNDYSTTLERAEDQSPNKRGDSILCSQTFENTFSEPPFKRLKVDFDINDDGPLSIYTVEWVKRKCASKGLKGRKIPFLALMLQNVDCSSVDPILSLRDPTGELAGTLHREVWREMGEHLRPGAAIALKQVGVLSTGTSRRQVLINITMNNIVTIYSPAIDGEVAVNSVCNTTTADLVKSIAEWQARVHNSPARSNELFSAALSSPAIGQNLFLSVSSNTSAVSSAFVSPNREPNGNRLCKKVQNVIEVKTSRSSNSLDCNFDFLLNDDDFNDVGEEPLKTVNSQPTSQFSKNVTGGTATSNIASNSDKRNINDHVMTESRAAEPFNGARFQICSQTKLSQAESLQVDEVLSGVDLDDFE